MTRPHALYAVAARRPLASDATLLAAWASSRDADAFAELVRRYGPLVWRVCRGVAGDTPAAEDAFQAAFLALSRRAGRVGVVPAYLHRVARRAAIRAARRDRPLRVSPPASEDPLDRLTARELLAAVDAEIARLPERQRLAVLLCGVDGLSVEEAATRLGWTAGAVRGGLQRGRERLRTRLAAKGLAVPAVLVTAAPERLTAAVMGVAPPRVADLLRGGLAMKLTAAAVLAVGLAAGVATTAPTAPPADVRTLWEGDLQSCPGAGAWHPDGKHVVAAGRFGKGPPEVRAWAAATGELVKRFPLPDGNGLANEASPTLAIGPGGRVAVATTSGAVVWDWDRPAEPVLTATLADRTTAVLLGRDGGRLFTLTAAGHLSAFRVGVDATEWKGAELPTPPNSFRAGGLSAALHPKADVVYVGHLQDKLTVWDADTLELRDTAERPLYPVPLVVRPDGRRLTLVTEQGVGPDRRLVIGGYALSTDGRRLNGLPTVTAPLPASANKDWGAHHLGYSPDWRFLAVAGKDGTARIVDAATAGVAGEWAEGGPVWAAAFSPDGRRLLTVSAAGVRVRAVDPQPVAPPADLRLTHEKELDRFAGRWRVTAARVDGEDRTAAFATGFGPELVAVDPAVTPKAANYRVRGGPGDGRLSYAIYEFLDADTYRVCLGLGGDHRPTAFAAEKGSRQAVYTFARVK